MNAFTSLLRSLIKNDYLLVSLISFLPVFEGKNAIILAVALGLDPVVFLPLCFLCSSAVAPLLLTMLKPLVDHAKKGKFGKVAKALEESVLSRQKGKTDALSLALFVAVPLPLTGIWSGAALGAMKETSFLRAILALSAGNALSCGLVYLTVALFPYYAESIFWISSLLSFLAVFAYFLVRRVKKREKPRLEKSDEK